MAALDAPGGPPEPASRRSQPYRAARLRPQPCVGPRSDKKYGLVQIEENKAAACGRQEGLSAHLKRTGGNGPTPPYRDRRTKAVRPGTPSQGQRPLTPRSGLPAISPSLVVLVVLGRAPLAGTAARCRTATHRAERQIQPPEAWTWNVEPVATVRAQVQPMKLVLIFIVAPLSHAPRHLQSPEGMDAWTSRPRPCGARDRRSR